MTILNTYSLCIWIRATEAMSKNLLPPERLFTRTLLRQSMRAIYSTNITTTAISSLSEIYCSLRLRMLLMHINHLLHLIPTPHENPRPIMNMLRQHLQHPLHPPIHRLPARVLKHHRHRRALIQNPQFPLRTLFIRRVGENAAVEEGTIGVCDHRANVPRAIGLFVFVLRVFEEVDVFLDGLVPIFGVALVDAVDGAGLGDAHVGVREDEFAEGVVHGEAVHTAPFHRHDQLRGSTIHCKPTRHQLRPRQQNLFLFPLSTHLQFEDAKDCADGDTGIEV